VHDINYSDPEFYGSNKNKPSNENMGMELLSKTPIWKEIPEPLQAVILMAIKQTDIAVHFSIKKK